MDLFFFPVDLSLGTSCLGIKQWEKTCFVTLGIKQWEKACSVTLYSTDLKLSLLGLNSEQKG